MNVGAAVLVGALLLGGGSACTYDRDPASLVSARDQPTGPQYPAGWGFFSGTVRDSDGAPITDVVLRPKGRSTKLEMTNLGDGTFRISVPGGNQTLVLERDGYLDVTLDAFIEPGQAEYFDVVMKRS